VSETPQRNQGDDHKAGGGRHRSRSKETDGPPPTLGRRALRWLREVVVVVAAALVLSFLLKTFLIQSFVIPSESMIPTLEKGDRVIVTKLAPGMLDLHRGDIVVFKDPNNWLNGSTVTGPSSGFGKAASEVMQAIGLAPADGDEFLIKRVIGLPGDKIACEGNGAPVTVNGKEVDETYVMPGADPSIMTFEVVVPKDALWVMGDNRPASADSRVHQSEPLGGAVSESNVVGVAQLRSWPMSRWSLLRNPGKVFADVPAANEGAGK
jgi:signal peptidase I